MSNKAQHADVKMFRPKNGLHILPLVCGAFGKKRKETLICKHEPHS